MMDFIISKGSASVNGSKTKNLIINEMLKLKHKSVSYVSSKDIVEEVKSIGKNGDIFLTMGAGNIWRYAEELGKHYNDWNCYERN